MGPLIFGNPQFRCKNHQTVSKPRRKVPVKYSSQVAKKNGDVLAAQTPRHSQCLPSPRRSRAMIFKDDKTMFRASACGSKYIQFRRLYPLIKV